MLEKQLKFLKKKKFSVSFEKKFIFRFHIYLYIYVYIYIYMKTKYIYIYKFLKMLLRYIKYKVLDTNDKRVEL